MLLQFLIDLCLFCVFDRSILLYILYFKAYVSHHLSKIYIERPLC